MFSPLFGPTILEVRSGMDPNSPEMPAKGGFKTWIWPNTDILSGERKRIIVDPNLDKHLCLLPTRIPDQFGSNRQSKGSAQKVKLFLLARFSNKPRKLVAVEKSPWICTELFNHIFTLAEHYPNPISHCALRTKSCAEFFTKLQQMPSECILELEQETISKLLLKSSVLSSKPELKDLINNYFDASAEASNICTRLLKSVNQIQSSHQEMQRVLLDILECKQKYTDNHSHEHFRLIASELNSFVINENPFSDQKVPTKNEFKLIKEKHSSLLHHLKSKSKKMARRIKLARCLNKATLACLALAFSAATTVTVLLALHTLVALLMGPIALFTIPFKKDLEKKVSKRKKIQIQCIEFVKTELLRRLRGQLDMAAKGTYILNRDFDTMSRLVLKIRDEVERNKAMTQFCLERKGERFEAVQEVVKEIRRSQLGLRKQADELQEHVCLCLVTINRARALVIKEILPSQHIVEM